MHKFVCLAIVVAGGIAVAAAADVPRPTSEQIEQLCGSRLLKVFAAVGAPQSVTPERNPKYPGFRPPTDDFDWVAFGYDGFELLVHENSVMVCRFGPNWKSPVEGVNVGDKLDDVVKLFGPTYQAGDGYYEWKLPDRRATMDTAYDSQTRKVTGISLWIDPAPKGFR